MLEHSIMPGFFYLIFVFGEVADLRVVAVFVADKMKGIGMTFYDVQLLQRGDDQQLKIQLAEKLEPIPGALIASSAKGFVDDDKPEAPAFGLAELQAELVSQGAR